MKAPIRKVLLKTSPFTVHFSKRYLKTPSWTFFYKVSAPNGRICGFYEISFKSSINQLEYHDLTKVITARLLTKLTFVLQMISEWQLLMIFCYTELLFARQFESDRTLISSRTSRSECLEKFILEIIRKQIPRKTNVVAPNLSKVLGRNYQ